MICANEFVWWDLNHFFQIGLRRPYTTNFFLPPVISDLYHFGLSDLGRLFCETQWSWPPLFSPSWLIQCSMGEVSYRGTCLRRPPLRVGTFYSQHVPLITKWRSAAYSGYNHARPVKFSRLYSVYLMKYAGNLFFEQVGVLGTSFLRRPPPCTKRPLLSLHFHMKAQNAHPETKQPSGRYRDMGGRFGITCLVHAKSEGAL